MKYFLSFIVLVLILLLTGCEKNSSVNSEDTLPLSIDSKIISQIVEIKEPGKEPHVVLTFYTEKNYSSAGMQIVGDLNKEGKKFEITLTGIKENKESHVFDQPAVINFNLNSINKGDYKLFIKINNRIVKGSIKVTEDAFYLALNKNEFVIPLRNEFMRVPENLIMGSAESNEPAHHLEFLDSLTNLGLGPHNLKAGIYWSFTVNHDGSINFKTPFSMNYGSHFIFRYNGDIVLMRNLIKRFAKKYKDSISISLYTGKGEYYFSSALQKEP